MQCLEFECAKGKAMPEIQLRPGRVIHRDYSTVDLPDEEDEELQPSETISAEPRVEGISGFLSHEGERLCPAIASMAHQQFREPYAEDATRPTKPRDPNGQSRPRGRGCSRGINHRG